MDCTVLLIIVPGSSFLWKQQNGGKWFYVHFTGSVFISSLLLKGTWQMVSLSNWPLANCNLTGVVLSKTLLLFSTQGLYAERVRHTFTMSWHAVCAYANLATYWHTAQSRQNIRLETVARYNLLGASRHSASSPYRSCNQCSCVLLLNIGWPNALFCSDLHALCKIPACGIILICRGVSNVYC